MSRRLWFLDSPPAHPRSTQEPRASLLGGEFDAPRRPDLEPGVRGTPEGAGLRELHALLRKLDPGQKWGKLRRVLTPTGEYLWLCPTHYREYDPGLPKLPGS